MTKNYEHLRNTSFDFSCISQWRELGFPAPDHMEIGQRYRVPDIGKSGRNRSASLLRVTPDFGIHIGFASGISGFVKSNGKQLSHTEKFVIQQEFKRLEEERRKSRAEATQACQRIWDNSPIAADDHAYLTKKQVQSHGLKLHQRTGALLVPVYLNKTLSSLQFILPEPDTTGRSKWFKRDAPISGGYYTIGGNAENILICEGYATAATLHEQTGQTVVMSFYADNLLSVAEHTKKLHPDSDICLCADNDHRTQGNPGLMKATIAAQSIGARLAVPEFSDDSTGTDWNDWYREFQQ